MHLINLEQSQLLDAINQGAVYHAPEPPVPVPDGTGGILFDLK